MPSPQDRKLNKPLGFAIARIAFLATSLFIGVTGFTILLSSRTISDISTRTRLSGYQRLGEQLRFSIERGLRLGRPLDGYAGLREALENALALASGLNGAAVAGSDGTLLYSVGAIPAMPDGRSGAVPPDDAAGTEEGRSGSSWTEGATQYVLLLPLADRSRARAGYLLLAADKESVNGEYLGFIRESVVLLLVLAAVIALIQSGWIGVALGSGRSGAAWRRSLYLILLLVAGGGQIAYSLPSIMYFAGALKNAERAKVEIVGKTVVHDLERLIGKGLHLGQITGFSSYFGDIIDNSPEIASIALRGDDGALVASRGEAPPGSTPVTLPVSRYWPDRHTPRRETATLELWTNPRLIESTVYRVYLNQLTALVISLLLARELAMLLVSVGFRRSDPAFAGERRDAPVFSGSEEDDGGADRGTPLIRIFSFLFFFGYDMVLSFIPLVAKTMPGSFLSLPDAQLVASPLTVEAIMGGAGILASGRLYRRLGFRQALCSGAGFAMAGAACAFLAPSISWFVLARALAGLGFGMAFMTCQLGLMARKSRAGDLAQMYSGLFSGSLCGVAGGAMAAELSGFRNVFAFSMLLFLASLWLAAKLPPRITRSPQGGGDSLVVNGASLPFFLSREFLGPVLLVTLPLSLSLAGFVYLGMPVELDRLGVPQGDIGRLFMLYGLCFILLGPLLAKLSDRIGKYSLWVSASGVVNGLALTCAWAFPEYPGYAASIALVGVGNCVHSSTVLICVSDGPLAERYDRYLVGSVLRMVERGGHMSGPMVISLLLSNSSQTSGLLAAGVFCIAAGMLLPFVRRAKAA